MGELARRQGDLRAQSRSNPELALSTRYDRAAAGLENEQTRKLSLRIPFMAGRATTRVSPRPMPKTEAGAELALEQERLQRESGRYAASLPPPRRRWSPRRNALHSARENRGFMKNPSALARARSAHLFGASRPKPLKPSGR